MFRNFRLLNRFQSTAAAAAISFSFAASSKSKCEQTNMDYIGIFLDQESRAALREKFQNESSFAQFRGDHVTLQFNPSDQQRAAFEQIMGKDAIIQLQAIARDEHVETAIVTVETPDEEFDFSTKLLHLTLSVQGTEGYESVYSNVLLERLLEEKIVQESRNEDVRVEIEDWEGNLAAFESKLLPYYNPFPQSRATVEILEEPIVLKGVVCSASKYDVKTHECPVKECGFCVFMRAGPCGEEFKKWEGCLDKCKKNGEDFIDHCGPETLALRDCVDAHPEYYSVLSQDEEEKEEDS